MRREIKQLAQIERLRKRLHEMSSWRLAQVAHEREQRAAAHAEMLEALGDGLMAYGPVSVAGTRRVRSLERDMALAKGVEKALEKRVLDDNRLAKLADRRLETLRETWREDLQRRSLEELIEATVASTSASRKR